MRLFLLSSQFTQTAKQKYSAEKTSYKHPTDHSGQQLLFLCCLIQVASLTVHHQLKIRNRHQLATGKQTFCDEATRLLGPFVSFIPKSEEKLSGETKKNHVSLFDFYKRNTAHEKTISTLSLSVSYIQELRFQTHKNCLQEIQVKCGC